MGAHLSILKRVMNTDNECVRFLQWCLPRLRLRWKAFRKVRRQVCRRISERIEELSLDSFADYRDYLCRNPLEWTCLRHCCRVTISRFYRDRAVFNALRWEVLPKLVSNSPLRVWSCGCASGEEAYTLRMIWEELGYTTCPLEIVATDTDRELLKRAEAGLYEESSLRELPALWKDRYFGPHEGLFRIVNSVRTPIIWLEQDVFDERPEGRFDLVLCRYLVFTYCEHGLQVEILSRFAELMTQGGALILGQMEDLPPSERFAPWIESLRIYRRLA